MTPTYSKIALTGTSGGIGSSVLNHLLTTLKYPASSLILSTSSPIPSFRSRLPASISQHADTLDIRQGDFNSAATLQDAFLGAEKVLIVSYPAMEWHKRVEQHKNAIDAAIGAGVRHIYYTSLAFTSLTAKAGEEKLDDTAYVMKAHVETEAYIRQRTAESGGSLKYTILREGIYAESFPLYIGMFDPSDSNKKLVVPFAAERGRVAWVARDELGEGTARIMLDQSGRFDDAIVHLTGSQGLTLSETVDVVSEVLGWTGEEEKLRIENAGVDGYAEYQLARKKSSSSLDRGFFVDWATANIAIEKGELGVTVPLLEELLGRKCIGFEEFVRTFLEGGQSEKDLKKYSSVH